MPFTRTSLSQITFFCMMQFSTCLMKGTLMICITLDIMQVKKILNIIITFCCNFLITFVNPQSTPSTYRLCQCDHSSNSGYAKFVEVALTFVGFSMPTTTMHLSINVDLFPKNRNLATHNQSFKVLLLRPFMSLLDLHSSMLYVRSFFALYRFFLKICHYFFIFELQFFM